MIRSILTVSGSYSGMRLDSYVTEMTEDISRSRVKKLIEDGSVLLNGNISKPSYKLAGGESVEINIPDPVEYEALPEDININIIYEDDDIIIVDKPKGMPVHPGAGHLSGTLVNALLFRYKDRLSGINGVLRPGIVHRIDMDTTGCLVVCKNDRAHNSIAAQLAEHSIKREYLGIVAGRLKESEGTINRPIGRSPSDRKKMACIPGGRRAVTHYKVLEDLGEYTYCRFTLETGRTHQIRVHMASIGHPLLGDEVYSSGRSPFKTHGQMLHAHTLGFIHPGTGEYVEFHSELPDEFDKILTALRSRI